MARVELQGLSQRVYAGVVEGLAAEESWAAKPTLTSFAERFGVSLSPVRTAVDRLIEDGFLTRSVTGRLRVADRSAGGCRRRVADTTKQAEADVQAELRAEVIRRGMLGDDSFVREQPLVDRYGVGRTALRAVMNKLAVEGLIQLVPRRGWRIRTFDKSDLCAFLEIREVLESRALELARPRLEEDRLIAFLAENESPDLNPQAPLSNELHDYWIGLAGNRYIVDFFSRDAVYYRTVFDYATPASAAVTAMAEQHCDILRALVEKKWTTADRALRRHICAQKPIVKALVEKLASG